MLSTASQWLWGAPVLLVLGTVGSVMTVVVMRRLTSGHSTPCMPVYFTALAISDFLILVVGLPDLWALYVLDYNIKQTP
jgi:hypothetical protein